MDSFRRAWMQAVRSPKYLLFAFAVHGVLIALQYLIPVFWNNLYFSSLLVVPLNELALLITLALAVGPYEGTPFSITSLRRIKRIVLPLMLADFALSFFLLEITRMRRDWIVTGMSIYVISFLQLLFFILLLFAMLYLQIYAAMSLDRAPASFSRTLALVSRHPLAVIGTYLRLEWVLYLLGFVLFAIARLFSVDNALVFRALFFLFTPINALLLFQVRDALPSIPERPRPKPSPAFIRLFGSRIWTVFCLVLWFLWAALMGTFSSDSFLQFILFGAYVFLLPVQLFAFFVFCIIGLFGQRKILSALIAIVLFCILFTNLSAITDWGSQKYDTLRQKLGLPIPPRVEEMCAPQSFPMLSSRDPLQRLVIASVGSPSGRSPA